MSVSSRLEYFIGLLILLNKISTIPIFSEINNSMCSKFSFGFYGTLEIQGQATWKAINTASENKTKQNKHTMPPNQEPSVAMSKEN